MTNDEAEQEYARGRAAVDRVLRCADDVTQDDFQYWIFYMDDDLRRYLDRLPRATRDRLDYSVESLDALEAWVLEQYGSSGEMLKVEELLTLDGVSRYIGETIRKQIGGRWEFPIDDPNYVFYRLPQLAGFGPRDTPACPRTLATAAASRRTGHYIRGVVENIQKQYRPQAPR